MLFNKVKALFGGYDSVKQKIKQRNITKETWRLWFEDLDSAPRKKRGRPVGSKNKAQDHRLDEEGIKAFHKLATEKAKATKAKVKAGAKKRPTVNRVRRQRVQPVRSVKG